jgi:hypothetical protein
MNAKQTVPLIAALAPAIATVAPVIIIAVPIFFALKWLLSDDEKKPETAPLNTEAEIPVKSASVPVSAPPSPPIPIPAPVIKSAVRIPPLPVKKKFVTREDLAIVFNRGTRSLTRAAAVAALKSLGFGRTAAYAALTPDGRFSAWLQFAPDGLITWTA